MISLLKMQEAVKQGQLIPFLNTYIPEKDWLRVRIPENKMTLLIFSIFYEDKFATIALLKKCLQLKEEFRLKYFEERTSFRASAMEISRHRDPFFLKVLLACQVPFPLIKPTFECYSSRTMHYDNNIDVLASHGISPVKRMIHKDTERTLEIADSLKKCKETIIALLVAKKRSNTLPRSGNHLLKYDRFILHDIAREIWTRRLDF